MPGRAPDMSPFAATILRRTLAEFEAASKLTFNRERVVEDIANPRPTGVGGGGLTQQNLKRVSNIHQSSVDAMVREVSCRLLGRKTSEPSTPGEAQVWADAASFFYHRIQVSAGQCPGRKADMSDDAAKAMRSVLTQISNQSEKVGGANMEAAQMLMFNHERVVQDITNPGPQNIDGKVLTQKDLKRVDIEHRPFVGAMVRELCCCLVSKALPSRLTQDEVQVWAEAARYLSGRIQGTPAEMPGRKSDMSSDAATALRTTLAQMEATHKLMSNRERVVQDIANPGPRNIEGKALTQKDLKRVDIEQQTSVDAMVQEVCCRLRGKVTCGPAAGEELVWADAARFLSGRIQGSPSEMPGRNPDMSADAAKALRAVLEPMAAVS